MPKLFSDMRDLIFDKPEALKANVELVRSVLSWPVAVFVVFVILLWSFKADFKRLIPLTGKIQVGESFLWSRQQNEIDAQVYQAQASVAAGNLYVSPTAHPVKNPATNPAIRTYAVAAKVYNEAKQDPRAALITIRKELDVSIREFLADVGSAKKISAEPIDNANALSDYLPLNVKESILLFFKSSAALLLGKDVSREEMEAAVRTGTAVLQTLNALPHERNSVAAADLPIFEDPEGLKPLPGFGILLETTGPTAKDAKTYRIFGTLRRGYYHSGMRVSWEWNLDHVWNGAYYRDPKTREIKKAWDGCSNFVGRDLTELSGSI